MNRRRILRWAVGVVVTVALLAAALLAMILHPVPLFPHHQSFEGFSVYSDREISDELASAIAAAQSRAAVGELYRPGARYRVFLAHNHRLYAFFCSLTRGRPESQALVFTHASSMIISQQGVQQMRERTGGIPRHTRLEGTLANAIAHEVAHLQVTAELGLRAARSLPAWKSEGWADYAANLAAARDDPDYSLAERARWLLDDARWLPPLRPVDRRHFRWHVLVEYLATVRGLSFAEILANNVTEGGAWDELRGWLAS